MNVNVTQRVLTCYKSRFFSVGIGGSVIRSALGIAESGCQEGAGMQKLGHKLKNSY